MYLTNVIGVFYINKKILYLHVISMNFPSVMEVTLVFTIIPGPEIIFMCLFILHTRHEKVLS